MELLIGCGNSLEKRIKLDGDTDDWKDLVTLDIDRDCEPLVRHDLNVLPYPFSDEQFSEIHAYEILEHLGRQGNWRFFFAQFTEFWRILEPFGKMYITCPHQESVWAWGDPGHARVLPIETFTFLERSRYEQIGTTTMTDYRHVYKVDFKIIFYQLVQETTALVLEKWPVE